MLAQSGIVLLVVTCWNRKLEDFVLFSERGRNAIHKDFNQLLIDRVFWGDQNIGVNIPIYIYYLSLLLTKLKNSFLLLVLERPDVGHVYPVLWSIQCRRRVSFCHTPVVVYPFTGMYLSLLLLVNLLLVLASFLLLVFLWCHTTAIMTVIMMQMTEQIPTIIISIVREYSPTFSSPPYRSLIFTFGSVVACRTETRKDKNNFIHCY